jgi:hypothetical protein
MSAFSLFPHFNNDGYVVLGAAFLVTVIINSIPILSYPFYLLFNMIHELGHVFAVRLTNGEVVGFWTFTDTSGVTRTPPDESGDPGWVLPAGYVGRTLFSALLILMSGFPYIAPYTLGVFGGLLLLLVLLYGKQSAFDEADGEQRTSVTLIVGLLFAVILIAVAWLAHLIWSIFLLDLLAIQGAFISLQTLGELAEQVRHNVPGIDPVRMADDGRHSPMFWVRVWSILSILILSTTIWFTWLRNLPGVV